MKEFVETLIGRLEEYKYSHLVEHNKERLEHCTENERAEHCEGIDCFWCVWEKSIEIVNQLAEEYNNGWIPCSERLPIGKEYRIELEDAIYYKYMLTTTNDSDIPMYIGWYDQENEQWYDIEGLPYHPIAWQPLPAPYQKGSE